MRRKNHSLFHSITSPRPNLLHSRAILHLTQLRWLQSGRRGEQSVNGEVVRHASPWVQSYLSSLHQSSSVRPPTRKRCRAEPGPLAGTSKSPTGPISRPMARQDQRTRQPVSPSPRCSGSTLLPWCLGTWIPNKNKLAGEAGAPAWRP